LIAAGAFMIKDDASGFGVADNVALPFVAIGIVGVTLLTASPAARDELTRGYRDVLDTAAELGKAMEASRPSDPSWQRARARERARETPDVQEGYDACRAFLQACLAVPAARGGLPTTRCFDCYRQCRGSGTGTWPRLRQCKFKGGP
jgi:hypothetical protein